MSTAVTAPPPAAASGRHPPGSACRVNQTGSLRSQSAGDDRNRVVGGNYPLPPDSGLLLFQSRQATFAPDNFHETRITTVRRWPLSLLASWPAPRPAADPAAPRLRRLLARVPGLLEDVFQKQNGVVMGVLGVGVVALFIITRGKWHK